MGLLECDESIIAAKTTRIYMRNCSTLPKAPVDPK
jgi:hypothetical protein